MPPHRHPPFKRPGTFVQKEMDKIGGLLWVESQEEKSMNEKGGKTFAKGFDQQKEAGDSSGPRLQRHDRVFLLLHFNRDLFRCVFLF